MSAAAKDLQLEWLHSLMQELEGAGVELPMGDYGDVYRIIEEAREPQLVDPLTAAQSFVDWINTEADIPHGYVWEMDTPGKRFVRIVMSTHTDPTTGERRGRSVHAFVDLATGDLLKAAGWKAPAKGPRGNLLTGLDEIKSRFTWSGGYLYNR
jgi:hypothetical protein